MKIKQFFCKHRNVEPYWTQKIDTKSKPIIQDGVTKIDVTMDVTTQKRWKCKYCGKVLNDLSEIK